MSIQRFVKSQEVKEVSSCNVETPVDQRLCDSWHHKIQSPLKAQQNTRIEISLKLRSGETKDGALMNRHVGAIIILS